jgi:fluoride ion exporter CrcB/FEX
MWGQSVLVTRFGSVFLGGALGGMLRYLLEELAKVNLIDSAANWSYLFVVNLAGAFLLGLTARHPLFDAGTCRYFWASGFAGGFTTMSALTLLIADHGWNPLIWLMFVLGVIGYGLGYRLGQRSARTWAAKQVDSEAAG